jgi:hypothetical protein
MKKRFKIEDWGSGRSYRSHFKNVFTGVGIAFTVAVLVIGLSVLVLYFVSLVRNIGPAGSIDTLKNPIPPVPVPAAIPASTPVSAPPSVPTSTVREEPLIPSGDFEKIPGLVYSTFYEAFSGMAWLDPDGTTMYHDRNMRAFVFPPKFKWEEVGISAGSVESAVPAGITGEVVKSGDMYKGLVYRADGTPVFDENNTPFVSKYPGELGFGGTDDDFIAVYGAYEGIAVRIRPAGVENISRFFGIRVMNGGFKPVISKIGDAWYVYSLASGVSKFVKLFDNGTGEIKGAVDLTDLSGSIRPIGQTGSDGLIGRSGGRYYRFVDQGFDKSAAVSVKSFNVDVYPWPLLGAVISPLYFSGEGAMVEFSLSNNRTDWREVKLGEHIEFPKGSGTKLFWQAIFKPDNDPHASPFLGGVRLDYEVLPG